MQAHALRQNLPHSPRPSILFFEDFEPPEAPVASLAPPPPALTAADLAEACSLSLAEGYQQGLSEARASSAEAASQALLAIAASLKSADETAAHIIEARAEVVTRLLLGALGMLFPHLSARFGPSEAAAMAIAIQPGLRHEQAVTVRMNPRSGPATAAAITAALRDLDPELGARLRFVETPSVPPGDVLIEWEQGAASRDAAALWQAVAEILLPLDLLDPVAPCSVLAA